MQAHDWQRLKVTSSDGNYTKRLHNWEGEIIKHRSHAMFVFWSPYSEVIEGCILWEQKLGLTTRSHVTSSYACMLPYKISHVHTISRNMQAGNCLLPSLLHLASIYLWSNILCFCCIRAKPFRTVSCRKLDHRMWLEYGLIETLRSWAFHALPSVCYRLNFNKVFSIFWNALVALIGHLLFWTRTMWCHFFGISKQGESNLTCCCHMYSWSLEHVDSMLLFPGLVRNDLSTISGMPFLINQNADLQTHNS